MQIEKLIMSVPLLAFSGFCVFGFLASFEPGNATWIWATSYAVLGTASLGGAGRLLSTAFRPERDSIST